MLADNGKVFRKKSSGYIVGDLVSFGYNYYDAEVGLMRPDIPKPEDYEEIDIPEDYEQPDIIDQVKRLNRISELIKQNIENINNLNLSDNDALKVKEWFPKWEDFISRNIEVGFIIFYNGNLWRVRQTHTALEIYPPSIDTAALYEIIVEGHEGTENDPIPFTPPMEIYNDKYYVQNGVIYRCIRSSGIALSYDLAELVNIYVEIIN